MYLVMPSTLYLHSCTLIFGFAADSASISPAYDSLVNIGLFLTQTEIFIFCVEECGKASLAPNLYFSIIISNSASISLP